MEVMKLTGGPVMTNCYIIYNEGEHDCVVIDPACEAEKIIYASQSEGLRIRAILLTHGHFDHLGCTDELRKKTGATVYVHAKDEEMLTSEEKNLSVEFGLSIKTDEADENSVDGDVITEAGMSFFVMSTPGHTRGSVCYITEDMIFSGDTLMNMTIGRTDFPGGDFQEMEKSLKRLLEIQGDPVIYPGHGESSSLLFEKDNNPFLSLL